MRLPALISDYLSHQHALGHRFKNEGFILRAFCKSVGSGAVSALTTEQPCAENRDEKRTSANHGRSSNECSGTIS